MKHVCDRDHIEILERTNKELRAQLAGANAELIRLKEAVSPGRVNVAIDYYVGVAKRMRRKELIIKLAGEAM